MIFNEELATKDYLKAELLDLKSSLLIWIFSMLLAFTGAIAAIVKWVK
jgi:hypothetical protein